jgi:exonuclease VII small subunit
MTHLQQTLLEQATDMWSRGHRIPTTLYARLAQQGLDVQTLEETHYVESPNEETLEESYN